MNSNVRSLAITLLLALATPATAEMNNTNDNIGTLVLDTNSGIPESVTNDRLVGIIRNSGTSPDGVVMAAPEASSQAPLILLIPGDVNQDGVFDISDVVGMLRGSVGFEYQNDKYYLFGDVSPNQAPGDDAPTNVRYVKGDGKVDIADVVAAMRALVRLIDLRFPQRAIYIDMNPDNVASIPMQGFIAKFYGPYYMLAEPPLITVSPAVLGGQEAGYGVNELNEFYAGIGFVGTNESPLRPGQNLVKIAWQGPAIGFYDGWQFVNTSDANGSELYGYQCADVPYFIFRYVTQVPGFAPEEYSYTCARG